MSAKHKTAWFWSDWAGDPAVRRLTPAERGVWIDLLCLASVGNPTGYVSDAQGKPLALAEIARFTNCASPDEAADLITNILKKGAASRDRSGRLFNRRMVRDATLSAKRQRSGQVGGTATALKWNKYWGLATANGLANAPAKRARALSKEKNNYYHPYAAKKAEEAAEGEPVATPRAPPEASALEVSPELARINQRKGWVR